MHELYNSFVKVSAQLLKFLLLEVNVFINETLNYELYCYVLMLNSVAEKIYRQTATLMGLQLIETYITVANSDDFKGITGRQYDDEECKQLEWPPVESLKKTYTSTHKISVLELMMCKIFQG